MKAAAIRTVSAICIILGIFSIVIQGASLIRRSFVFYDAICHGIWAGVLYILAGSLGITAARQRTRSLLIATLVVSVLSIAASMVAAVLSGFPALVEYFTFCNQSQRRCHPTILLVLQWALMAVSVLAFVCVTTLTALTSKAVCSNQRKNEDSNTVPYVDIATITQTIEVSSNKDELIDKKPKRLAEILAQKSSLCANQKGAPNVYLLSAKEIVSNDDFRWFNIGRTDVVSPSEDHRDHKVIILMGATGCGKSTLINGMVNYILGVRWKDPFRFKCVRDDMSIITNHARTNTVTAYTLRHQDGMTVPFSITIIDTPGYGDTKGVKRDKQITRNIQHFLTQHKTRIDQIHAACFVAASGDSRLTATQRYAIDSMFSIFGKDIKENIRLLVTFADNSQPAVVDACAAANFPVTSPSAGITYSKFNSSVLYADNTQPEDEDFSFDERFWDMSQENYYKFFTMLGGMNGRGRKSAPEVFQSRQLLEHSLEDMKRELADCLVNIENMEMFRRQMREYGHKMDQFNDQVQISLMRSRAAEELQ
ncbi:uncharacterized protein LOC130685839 [Daphnia carinata]|uniref:uncharacterized protein LOC130685839 n=1 Tax=Daphnia carinata TaxID=120202 RepID=UPI00257EA32A|nr:uncharacterized protein LOC130685839 [Daphnia carinata]